MIFKKIFLQSVSITAVIYFSFILFFIVIDDYGLFYKNNRNIYTAENERTSKYLFTYNYIPSNFNGILLGPSLGAQIDTSKLNDYKIFNLSLNGANATELYILLNNLLKQDNNIQVLILTLHGYTTATSGRKSSRMVEQEFFASFSSIDAIKLQLRKLVLNLGLAKNYFNANGYMNMNLAKEVVVKQHESVSSSASHDKTVIEMHNFNVDSAALLDFNKIIDLAHSKSITLIGYFHPDYYLYYESNKAQNESYKKTIKAMFAQDDILIDFNTTSFDSFRKDPSNFLDNSHLSYKGEHFIVSYLNQTLYNLRFNKELK